MKNRISAWTIVLLLFVFSAFRLQHGKINGQHRYNVATWDAFGYYMYLPSAFIYHDVKELKWVPKIDSVYQLTGGVFYQASQLENGTYTNKYLCGVAVMQSPFFALAHRYALSKHYPPDGFSWPYQFGLVCAALCWTLIGFIFLRKVLLMYFSDSTVALTLLSIGLCSNLIQYSAVDSGQSHCYIFALYSLVLWFTYQWHASPKAPYAFAIGLICGLAVISRPTELIIIFIPLLWHTNPKLIRQEKWAMVAQHKRQILICMAGGLMGILPQIIYWKYTTGSFIYDVGSKWFFLNPWFRVLFGPEKGWFLYTPIAIFMVAGLWFLKKYPFQKAVITFCLLNIWIIISWSDWRYGGSYSTRALVQSYPVFALALAAFFQYFSGPQKQWAIYLSLALLTMLNFYQLTIYNRGIGESFSPLLKLFS